MVGEVVPLRLTATAALRMVRELAADTDRIVVLSHATARARKRRISRRQIELCCQRGTISEGPFLNQHGQWQANMFRHASGEEITCPVAIDWPNRLLVITVF